jgi:Icc-related predicted phosphoesterase
LNFDVQVIAGDYSGKGTVKAGGDNTIKLEPGKVDIDRLID